MVWLKLVSLCAVCVAGSWALSLVVSQEQSYFFGTRPGDNLLCYTKTIPKGSTLPVAISFTSPNDKKINFVTMNADKYSVHGYTVDKTDGQLGTTSIGYRINGPSPLFYTITIHMYCAP
uniref:GOLD domain-containing protein n=1 Tax=Anopheles culicifacies TaxID=139723 RepID=A0A182LRX9_9DIPT